jgi:hypothetical protein
MIPPDNIVDCDEVFEEIIELVKCYKLGPNESVAVLSVALVSLAKALNVTKNDFVYLISKTWDYFK